jgi:hypothetical protein
MRFSSALKIESPKNVENQGAQFFPPDQVQDKDQVPDTEKGVVEDKGVEEKVVQEIEKPVNETPQDELVAQEQRDAQKQEVGQVVSPSKALNEVIPTAPIPIDTSSVPVSDKASTNTSSSVEAKTTSGEISRKEIQVKSKTLQKELRIRKLPGHDQERAQFSLKGGSLDAKLSKPSQSLRLEKTCRLDGSKKESSQSLDTDASPPTEGWWEMFILFWFACGKKVRMLMVALFALFAVVFSRVPKNRPRSSRGHNRDNAAGASKSVSSPSALPPASTK